MRVIIVFFILVGCRVSSPDTSLKKIIQQELGDIYKVELNTSRTLALAWNKSQDNVNYMVIKLSSNSVILRKTNIHAKVKWHDDKHIEEITKPGQVKKNESPNNGIKIIDVNVLTGSKK